MTPSRQIRSHIKTQAADPTSDTRSKICTTVEVTSNTGDSHWLQLHQGSINFQHLDDAEKDEILGDIIDSFPVPENADVEPGEYMTFDISPFPAADLDQFIDRLIAEYFAATSPGAVSCQSEML